MQVGKSIEGKIKVSKTKCVFVSAPKIFYNNIPSKYEEIEGEYVNSLPTEGAQEVIEKKKSEIKDTE